MTGVSFMTVVKVYFMKMLLDLSIGVIVATLIIAWVFISDLRSSKKNRRNRS